MSVRDHVNTIRNEVRDSEIAPERAAILATQLSALLGNIADPLITQVAQHVLITADCWLWTGAKDGSGYGMVRVGGKAGRTKRVHRAIWEAAKGAIPNGHHLDHLCRVRNCVNPAHLEVVTPHENYRRGRSPWRLNEVKTHCKRGHLLNGDNLYMWRGYRQCRVCNTARVTTWKRAHKTRKTA